MRFEMMKVLKGRQDKFIYYIAGLNVAAIGFTLSKTYDFEPSLGCDAFLCLALLLWLVSTITSFRWIIIQFRTMERNMDVMDLKKGHFNKSEISESMRKSLILKKRKKIEEDAHNSSMALKATLMLFIAGIVMFIIWRGLIVFDSALCDL